MPRPRGVSDFRQREIELNELQPLTTRCLLCGWSHSSTAADARQKAAEHRSEAHPELPPYRRPVRKTLSSFRQYEMDDAEKEEINRERRRRAYLSGVDFID